MVFAKRPFGGPAQIVTYLGRYTHRVGIASSRLVSISDEKIVFRTRGEKTCSVTPDEFIRRFLLHVLPHQFFKIRHYGLLAPANVKTRLVRAQEILGPIEGPIEAEPEPVAAQQAIPDDAAIGGIESSSEENKARSERTAVDRTAPACPHCGGPLVAIAPPKLRLVRAPPPGA